MPELLEAVDAAFDEVSLFVQGTVVAAGLFPVPPWRDHGNRARRFDRGDDLGRIAPLVCDDGFGSLAFQQADCLGVFGRPVQP